MCLILIGFGVAIFVFHRVKCAWLVNQSHQCPFLHPNAVVLQAFISLLCVTGKTTRLTSLKKRCVAHSVIASYCVRKDSFASCTGPLIGSDKVIGAAQFGRSLVHWKSQL